MNAFLFLLAEVPPFAEPVKFVFLKLCAVGALVLLNAFFSAAEVALVRIRSTQLETLIEKGIPLSEQARYIVANQDKFLPATQLGISLASIALGWLGTPFLASLLASPLSFFGIAQTPFSPVFCFAVALVVIAYAHIVAGSLVPKSLALRHSLNVLIWTARPLSWFYSALRPLAWFFGANAGFFLRHLFRSKHEEDSENSHSEEELRVILAESGEEPSLGREILINALDFKHRVAFDVMTPRGEVVYLDVDEPFDEQISVAIQSRHTRFPLCRGHIDDAVGLAHIKDLLALCQEGNQNLLSVKRELHHVSELMPLEKLLRFFLSKQTHLAVVVDEYGSSLGIVTLDNVLEELVGSINDEFDAKEESSIRQIDDNEFEADGSAAIYELEDLLEETLDDSDVSTIGGYITARLGHIPHRGEELAFSNFLATVSESDPRRVIRVHFKRLSPEQKNGGHQEISPGSQPKA